MRGEVFYNNLNSRSFVENPEIQKEIFEYVNQKLAGKDTTSIYSDLDEDGKFFDERNLIEILELYLENKIGEWDLEYLLNWIEMSGYEFPENVHENVVFIFSTPEINYPININNIKEAISFLKKEKSLPEYSGEYDKKAYSSKVIGY
jgi:hypothetical protein